MRENGTMHKTVDVTVAENIFEANYELAQKNAVLLKENGIYSLDFLGAIGSGKTMLIEGILDWLVKGELRERPLQVMWPGTTISGGSKATESRPQA